MAKEFTQVSAAELKSAVLIPNVDTSSTSSLKVMACAGNATNDNFANAATLVVGVQVGGTTCGSLEAGETTACNTGTGLQTVWYKFIALAATQYVQIAYTSGACYFGSAVYSGTALPTSACADRPISCQAAAYGPLNQLYQLTGLTVGATYYIQVVYGAGGGCGTNGTFNIQVTNTNPGGGITNPAPINSCSSPAAGCFFNSPPSANTVTSTCTSYPLAAAGYSANSVVTITEQFTSSPNWANFSWQAIITSNCGGGNVNWLNWTLYNCSCGIIACGDLTTLTGTGLACSVCYRLEYQFELASCSSFTQFWPYQNVPSSPTPCNTLPLELLYFIGNYNSAEHNVGLSWATAQEANTKEFRIDRSDDGVNFVNVGVTEAAGNSNSTKKYEFKDHTRLSDGTYYYKLVEVDKDKSESLNKIIAIAVEDGSQLMRFAPNPAQNYFDIIFAAKTLKQQTRIEVYNNLGEKMTEETFTPEDQLKHIDISSFPNGLYMVNIITPASSKVIRQIIAKQ